MLEIYPSGRGQDRYAQALRTLDRLGFRAYTKDELEAISRNFARELQNGLDPQTRGSLAMINTRLRPIDFSSLTPNQQALVIEVGGTNVYGGWVSIDDNHNLKIAEGADSKPAHFRARLPTSKFESADDFCSRVVASIQPLLEGRTPDALGIVWSYPGETTVTNNGVDVTTPEGLLTKEISIPGIGDRPVGQSFLAHIEARKKVGKIPVVVLNDTPAVLLAGEGRIGGVVATGFNLAVAHQNLIYNTESGNFNGFPKDGVLSIVDERSEKPGAQLAEKVISGLYMARQMSVAIELLKDQSLVRFLANDNLSAETISRILKGEGNFKDAIDGDLDTDDLRILTALAAAIRERSAQLVGVMVGTSIETFKDEFGGEVNVPVEGSVFWGASGYPMLVKKYASFLTKSNLNFVEIKNAGLLGAGAAALSVNSRG